MAFFSEIKNALLHLVLPHICASCGSNFLPIENEICSNCISQLPETFFSAHPGNPVEKIFWGRLLLQEATCVYYFSKKSTIQNLMHELKYAHNIALGKNLGRLMGSILLASSRFKTIDAIVPLPLHPKKEFIRGYNQANIIAQGIADILNTPVINTAVVRKQHTSSQTNKSRIERLENIRNSFFLQSASALEGKHILLVDDVLTTGATLEACGKEILNAPQTKLSIACLCLTQIR